VRPHACHESVVDRGGRQQCQTVASGLHADAGGRSLSLSRRSGWPAIHCRYFVTTSTRPPS